MIFCVLFFTVCLVLFSGDGAAGTAGHLRGRGRVGVEHQPSGDRHPEFRTSFHHTQASKGKQNVPNESKNVQWPPNI